MFYIVQLFFEAIAHYYGQLAHTLYQISPKLFLKVIVLEKRGTLVGRYALR